MIIQNKRIFASILFVFVGFVSVAQGSGPPPPTPPPPPGLPIDGMLYLLFSAGVIFAVRSLLKGKYK